MPSRREIKAVVRSRAHRRSQLGGSTRPVWRRRALAGDRADRESKRHGQLLPSARSDVELGAGRSFGAHRLQIGSKH
jgi:hypothetical protein